MKKKMDASSMENWGLMQNIQPKYHKDFPTRKILTIAVGSCGDEFILEEFFEDDLEKILSKEYKKDFRIELTPKFVVTDGTKLIRYNPYVGELSAKTKEILNEIDVKTKMQAMTEVRLNKYNNKMMGESANRIKEILNQRVNVEYNFKFLAALLIEMYEEECMRMATDVEKSLAAMSREMLIDIYGQAEAYRRTGDIGNRQFAAFYNVVPSEKLCDLINKEIAKRFYLGEFR